MFLRWHWPEKSWERDVGQWFGPGVVAGAIEYLFFSPFPSTFITYRFFLRRTLVSSFLECGLAVAVAFDSTLYQTYVIAASHGDTTALLTTDTTRWRFGNYLG